MPKEPKDEDILRFQYPGRRPGTRRAGWLHNYGTGAAHEAGQEHAPQTKAGAVGAAVMRLYYKEEFTFLLRCILKAAQFVLIGKFALSGAVGALTGLKKYDDAVKLAREWRVGGWLRSDAGFGVLNPRGRSVLLKALEFLKRTGEVPESTAKLATRLLEQVTAGSVGAVRGMSAPAVGLLVARKAWEHRHDFQVLTKIFLAVAQKNKENAEKVAAADGDLNEILSPPLITPTAEWGKKLRTEADKGWASDQQTYGPFPAYPQLLAEYEAWKGAAATAAATATAEEEEEEEDEDKEEEEEEEEGQGQNAHVEAYLDHLERRSAAHPPRFSHPDHQTPSGGKKTKHKRKKRNRCASKKYKKSSKRKSRCCASKKHRRSSKSKRSPTRRSRM